MRIARTGLHLPVSILLAGALVAFALLAGLAPAGASAGSCNFGGKRANEIKGQEARQSIKCLVNKQRNNRGKGGYSSDSRLVKAADKHSGVMASKGCFSHQCPGERSLLGRLQSVNYIVGGLSAYAYGENIAYGARGSSTPRQMMKKWMNSPPHRAAILSGKFKEMGVGFENRGDKGYYTIDFGFRRG
jgi:uncharacterized protein YkwD